MLAHHLVATKTDAVVSADLYAVREHGVIFPKPLRALHFEITGRIFRFAEGMCDAPVTGVDPFTGKGR